MSSLKKLYVGGLSIGVDDDDLKKLCSHYGTVTFATVTRDVSTGRSRGYGFVTFSSPDEAQSAIQGLDNQELGGSKIKVNLAKELTEAVGIQL